MELYQEILLKLMGDNENYQIDATKIVELECYKALRDIKAVIEDDSFEDAECFYRIEEIVQIFERLGSDGGSRHDFG
ncbi:MAG: hypothetical protein IJZ89_03980 [Clostridia bacterium]|nr:hypothetical protein [Clostridia bacterium]